MVHKQLMFQSQARAKILRGASALTDAVRITLGPKSKSVLIQKKWGTPIVCNDGVAIAKEVEFQDPEENLGARMLREAAEKTGDSVGDGTSTSTILANAIYSEGVKNVEAGASAIDLKRGLDHALKIAVEAVKTLSKPVQSYQEKLQVASVSAHNDEAIGSLVAQAIEKVGGDGVVTVEEAKGTETSIETVEGMQFDRGYLSAYFITDSERMEAILERSKILICDKKINTIKELVPILEQLVKMGQPLLIIAEEVEAEALATLVVNKINGTLRCIAVKAPGFGDRRKAMLEDIAVLTGAQLISDELGRSLENLSIDQLGEAERVVSDRENTVIVGGHGNKEYIQKRINQIRKELEKTESSYDKEKLQERLAKLMGGVAVIRVGAPTEAELKSKKDALEDAISSTKAAISEGIIPGGGLALLRASFSLESEEAKFDGDFKTGIKILRHALEIPTRQIAENSGVDGGVVVDQMKKGKGNYGFDAAKREYVDLMEKGIVDATKVIRVAMENAVSVASTLLLTEATLTEVPEKESKEPEGIAA